MSWVRLFEVKGKGRKGKKREICGRKRRKMPLATRYDVRRPCRFVGWGRKKTEEGEGGKKIKGRRRKVAPSAGACGKKRK